MLYSTRVQLERQSLHSFFGPFLSLCFLVCMQCSQCICVQGSKRYYSEFELYSLSTTCPCFYINVQEVLSALDHFSCYHHIWRNDREDTMRRYVKYCFRFALKNSHKKDFFVFFLFYFNRFIQGNHLLSEFESQILFYRDLEVEINSEPEYITVGALALFTG